MEAVDIAVVVLAFLGLFWLLTHLANRARHVQKQARRRREGDRVRPRYEYEAAADRYARRLKGVQAPAEDHDRMVAFVRSRTGVEAYVEPKTVMHPLSVVLVAGDGEWIRCELADDAFVKELARTHHVPVLDAARTGYPERMRRYRRPTAAEPPAESEPRTDDARGGPPAGTPDDPAGD